MSGIGGNPGLLATPPPARIHQTSAQPDLRPTPDDREMTCCASSLCTVKSLMKPLEQPHPTWEVSDEYRRSQAAERHHPYCDVRCCDCYRAGSSFDLRRRAAG